MKIFLTRHGQTEWNALQRIQGRVDIPLNDEGIKQAYITRDELKGIHLDAIITSPLQRAFQTAEIINEVHQLSIIKDERVIERAFGKYEGTYVYDMDFTNFWNPNNKQILTGDGESSNDFFNRVYEFIKEITITYRGKNILIVAHGGVSLPFYTYFSSIPTTNDMRSYMLNNCQVATYVIED